ncbi:MAG: tRNA 2-selenouridine(34) synthase MnmH [Bacteroidales bacterium]|jgi:tRNA 2-selenouridine synthase|nr:tRNA 2-selenouridine(34) synthase MnmH [Bacteroidales bacterium]
MAKVLSAEEFIKKAETIPLLDVRSPGEYAQAHIPGALSLPLFNDEERAKVGTLYKQQGKIISVQKGLEIVGPKLKGFTKYALKLDSPEILIHCWRGGMRSSSMAWLMETVGLKVFLLEGGYKAYRRLVLDSFEKPLKIILLGGYTGSGKTEILQQLREAGEQILDLEGLANHKGSAFGALGQPVQPSTEQFENFLYKQICELDLKRPVWVEDESRNVGKVFLPQAFWERMRNSPLVRIDTPYEIRLARLMRDYACFEIEGLASSIKRIEKRLGFDKCKRALDACNSGDRELAARICLDYYDAAYGNQLDTRFGDRGKLPSVVMDSLESSSTVMELQKLAERIVFN